MYGPGVEKIYDELKIFFQKKILKYFQVIFYLKKMKQNLFLKK